MDNHLQKSNRRKIKKNNEDHFETNCGNRSKKLTRCMKQTGNAHALPETLEDCRFCLLKIDGNKFEISEDVSRKFKELTQNLLRTTTKYSRSICRSCKENLEMSCSFKKMILENQDKLYNSSFDEEPFIKTEAFEEEIKTEDELLDASRNEDDHFVDMESENFENSFKTEEIEDEKRESCPECNKRIDPKFMHIHINRIHRKHKIYKCDFCDHRSSSKKLLLHHLLEIHKNDFTTPGSLLNHKFKQKNHKESFDCSQCFKTFRKKFSLDRHILKTHLNIPVKDARSLEAKERKREKVLCPYCGECFKRDSLRAHVDRKHLKKKNFICDLCDYRAYYKNNLRYHILAIHQKSKNFQCSLCLKFFSTPATLTNHKFVSHNNKNDNVVFTCQICLKDYTRKSHLERHHKQVHLQEGKFTCKISDCGKFFNCKTKFRNHQAMHGEPKLPCCECGKLFHNEDNLRHHKNYHKKQFQCELCQKTYAAKNMFDSHMKVHLGQRDFFCKQCDKSYYRKSHLDRHVKHYHLNIKTTSYKRKPQQKNPPTETLQFSQIS